MTVPFGQERRGNSGRAHGQSPLVGGTSVIAAFADTACGAIFGWIAASNIGVWF